ncbi:MAG: hypothetical protein KC517_09345 [Bacteroidetes bacterium]|nr:hypothetical protein [Bacteroidota bacterium]
MIDWIDVNEELPPPHTEFIGLYENGNVFPGTMCYGMHEHFFCDNGRSDLSDTIARGKVTYWAKFNPPKSGEESQTTDIQQLKAKIAALEDRLVCVEVESESDEKTLVQIRAEMRQLSAV